MNLSVRDLNKILSRHAANNDVKQEVCNSFLNLSLFTANSIQLWILILDQTSEKKTQEPLLCGQLEDEETHGDGTGSGGSRSAIS